MPQTSYAVDPTVAFPGMLGDTAGYKDGFTGIAHAAIPFGRAVCRHSDGTFRLPALDADVVVGVAVYQPTMEQPLPGGSAPPIQAQTAFYVLTKGRVWMDYDGNGAVAAGGALHVCDAAGTVADQGKCTAANTSADAVQNVAGGRFRRTGTSSVALVDLNLPNG